MICINQCAIADDLECLPIFIAGCNTMLVISGPTYTSRLWCVMELYVFFSMQGVDEQQTPSVVITGATSLDRSQTRQSWACFDALQCRCFNPGDKERIMAVIQKGDGGIDRFNAVVQGFAASLAIQQD